MTYDGVERRLERPKERVQIWLVALLVVITVVFLATASVTMVIATQRIGEISQRQIANVQDQNDVQLCAQYRITLAVRKVAAKLGLPTRDINLPDLGELDCDDL